MVVINPVVEKLVITSTEKEVVKAALTRYIEASGTKNYLPVVAANGDTVWINKLQDIEVLVKMVTAVPVVAPADAKIQVSNPADIIQTFMELTKYTCPHGFEDQLYSETLRDLGFIQNKNGNWWKSVGTDNKTLFVAHLDTADLGIPKQVSTELTEDGFLTSDATSILGADDKAGLTLLLYLLHHNIPGDYLLVVGEEVGCIGSKAEALNIPANKYDRAIQFDRQGTSEIITHQLKVRTASRGFARALGKEISKASNGVINLNPSDLGMYTDTKEFAHLIPECTNIAVGYEGQHTVFERQDMAYLVTLAEAIIKVDWDNLPVDNTPSRDTVDKEAWMWDNDLYEDELEHTSMWEVWGNLECGDWKSRQVEDWVEQHSEKAAAFITAVILHDPVKALDFIQEVELV